MKTTGVDPRKGQAGKKALPNWRRAQHSGGSGLHTRSGDADFGEDDFAQLVTMPEDALDEDIDPSFDLDSSMKADADHLEENYCEEWISHKMTDCVWICFCAFSCPV